MGLQDIKFGKRLFEKQNKGEKEEELAVKTSLARSPRRTARPSSNPRGLQFILLSKQAIYLGRG
jgi:hypothetical protein